MKIREYRGPLTVLASGVVGFSLFCIVSAAAISGPNVSNTPLAIGPQDLVDSAISNINTMAALTMQSVAEYIPTATISPTNTSTQTDLPTSTATLIPTRTRIPPTRTRSPFDPLPTLTNTRLPTRTNTPVPPSPTDTLEPTASDTPLPTDTPEPPPTDTPEPPPTDTPEPPPSDTPEPPPTATSEFSDEFNVTPDP